ncbi:MAG: TetR/AcrR family transcriptional regulator [Candidatus Kapabacteria bacterium]|nr:TetR/AcrR family transcriptional regulator [Candidatus Kapabacteria bacterium]
MAAKKETDRTDEELRAQAKEAALETFFTKGYTKSTADAIAKKMRVSKKTLYRLFPSKEDLLRAVAVDVVHEIEEITDKLYNDHARPINERVAALVTQVSPHYARIRSPRILRDIQRNAPLIWSELEVWRQSRYAKFRHIIDDGIKQGEIRTDISIEDILTVYSVMLNKCMDHAVLDDSDVTPLELYRGFMDVYFRGILVSSISLSYDVYPSVITQTKDEVLTAAESLFFRFGYSKTTTEEIAREAGISKRTMYKRFSKKSDIAIAVLRQAALDVKGLTDSLRYDSQDSYISNLQALVLGYKSALGRFSAHFLHDLELSSPSDYRSMLRWRRRLITSEMTRALTMGQHIGLVRHDLHVPSTVLLIRIAIKNLLLPLEGALESTISVPALNVVCSVIFAGISPRTTRSPLQPTH